LEARKRESDVMRRSFSLRRSAAKQWPATVREFFGILSKRPRAAFSPAVHVQETKSLECLHFPGYIGWNWFFLLIARPQKKLPSVHFFFSFSCCFLSLFLIGENCESAPAEKQLIYPAEGNHRKRKLRKHYRSHSQGQLLRIAP
jgi:hypothetical protein